MQNHSPTLDLLNQNQYVIEIPKLLGCTVMFGRYWPSEHYTDPHTQISFLGLFFLIIYFIEKQIYFEI